MAGAAREAGGSPRPPRAVAWVMAAWVWSTAPAAAAAPPPGAVPAKQVDRPQDEPDLDAALPPESSADAPDSQEAGPAAERILQIEEVVIEGREQVSRDQIVRVLRREKVVAGAELTWPDDERVQRAVDRLRSTGYFKSVTIRLEPIKGSKRRVRIVLSLVERSTVSVDALYAGTSLATPFWGGVSVTERNFVGRGVLLGGSLIWGTLPRIDKGRRQQGYRVFAEAPRLGDARLGVLASAYLLSASEPYRVAGPEDDPDPDLFRTLDYSRIGGIVGLTFPVLPELSLGADYRFERIDARLPQDPTWVRPDGEAVPLDLALREDQHRLTAAHFGIAWDGRADAFVEGKGGRFGLDFQVSSPALGSNYEYIKLVAAGAYTFRLPWRHWITPKVSGGQIAGRAPRFELFYSGDLSEWTPGREQGLRYSTRNPVDVFGTGIDKRTFGVIFGRFDLEYVWPLFRRARTRVVYGGDLVLSAGVFSLVEDAATRDERRDNDEMVAPIGFNADFGIRLDTPVGTINVTVGNVLRRVPL